MYYLTMGTHYKYSYSYDTSTCTAQYKYCAVLIMALEFGRTLTWITQYQKRNGEKEMSLDRCLPKLRSTPLLAMRCRSRSPQQFGGSEMI